MPKERHEGRTREEGVIRPLVRGLGASPEIFFLSLSASMCVLMGVIC